MAGDPYWNNVVLAMHMDDVGLSDLKGHAVTLNGNAARSSVQSKFGGYSTAFDGTGDYLSLSDSEDWNFGAGDFTIEFWVRPSVISGAKFVLSQRTSNTVNNAIALYVWDTGVVYFDWSTSGSSTTDGLSSAATLVEVNAWYHVAVARSGETMRMSLRASVEAAVAAGNQELKDAWEFAQEFKRLDPLVLSLGAALGVNDEGLDNLFNLAATL